MPHIKLTSQIAWPPAGRYVLAVSGGADSMTLLDLFVAAAGPRSYQLIVAHFDHGLRSDSAADFELVAATAARHRLPFDGHHARLPSRTSEAAARAARYAWLHSVCNRHQAAGIITAHHADDLIETSLLNLARGTGRRGLAPMQAGPIRRPLLAVSRAALRDYAAARQLVWHDDATNADVSNPRNFLRRHIVAHASDGWTNRYLGLIANLARLNRSIDMRLAHLLDIHQDGPGGFRFPRDLIRDLAPAELVEVILAAAYRLNPAVQLDRRLLSEMVMFAKIGPPHRHRPLRQGLFLSIEPTAIVVKIANPPQNRPDIVY
jgi:tRNA(Ile)-lysidine synthase